MTTEPFPDQIPLFDDTRVIPSRTTDPETSHVAAAAVTMRAGSQRARLLAGFEVWSRYGATDEQAMEQAEDVYPTSEYSKRCSELREGGYIQTTGETRCGAAGVPRIVSVITAKGLAWLKDNA